MKSKVFIRKEIGTMSLSPGRRFPETKIINSKDSNVKKLVTPKSKNINNTMSSSNKKIKKNRLSLGSIEKLQTSDLK